MGAFKQFYFDEIAQRDPYLPSDRCIGPVEDDVSDEIQATQFVLMRSDPRGSYPISAFTFRADAEDVMRRVNNFHTNQSNVLYYLVEVPSV
jgi:hypothetical protein